MILSFASIILSLTTCSSIKNSATLLEEETKSSLSGLISWNPFGNTQQLGYNEDAGSQKSSSLLSPPVVNHANWGHIFTDICWFHSLRSEDPYSICGLHDQQLEGWRDQQCTLMDVFLSARHYHPAVGRSRWKSKFPLSEEAKDESAPGQVYNSTSSERVVVFPRVGRPMWNSSLTESGAASNHDNGSGLQGAGYHPLRFWARIPQHQRMGLTGLFAIGLLVSFAVAIGISKNSCTFSEFLQLAFDYHHHLLFIFTLPKTGKETEDQFSFFNGLRVISMFWVISGHSILYWSTFLPFSESSRIFFQTTSDPLNYPLFASIFAVDNFFYISGFFTGYQLRLSLDDKVDPSSSSSSSSGKRSGPIGIKSSQNVPQLERCTRACFETNETSCCPKRKISFREKAKRKMLAAFEILRVPVVLVIRRYIRLMGVHAILLFGYLAIDWNQMSLPAGSRYLQSTNVACTEVVPSLLLLVNNLVHGEFVNECFGWTWYLANDFQFFLIGLMIVLSSLLFPVLTWTLIATILSMCLVASTAISLKYQLGVVIDRYVHSYMNAAKHLQGRKYLPVHPIMDYFYVKSYVRISPHLIGLGLGLTLAECRINAKKKADGIHKPIDQQLKETSLEVKNLPLVQQPSPAPLCSNLDQACFNKPPEDFNTPCNLIKYYYSSHAIKDDSQRSILHDDGGSFFVQDPVECHYYHCHRLHVSRSLSAPPPHTAFRSQHINSMKRVSQLASVHSCFDRQTNCSRFLETFSTKSSRLEDPDGTSEASSLSSSMSNSLKRPINIGYASQFFSARKNVVSNSLDSMVGYSFTDSVLVYRRHKASSLASVSTMDSLPHKGLKVTYSNDIPSVFTTVSDQRSSQSSLSSFQKGFRKEQSSAKAVLTRSIPGRTLSLDKSFKNQQHVEMELKSCNSEGASFAFERLPSVMQYMIDSSSILLAITFGIPTLLIVVAHLANHAPLVNQYWSTTIDGLFLTASRPLWGFSLAGMTVMMIFSQRDNPNLFSFFCGRIIYYIKSVLSHPWWSPMSKLSYSIYLCHPIVLFAFYGNGYGPRTFSRGYLFFCYILTLLMSFCGAILISTFIEMPIKYITAGFFKVLMAPSSSKVKDLQAAPLKKRPT